MKLAVAIADTHAEASAFVVWRGFAESIQKASAYGYDGVELALCTKDEVDVATLRKLLSQYQMEVSCISTGQVFAKLGLYLTSEDNAIREKCISVLTGLIELAGEFGGMINLGRTRGFVAPEQTNERAQALFLQSIEQLLPIAQKHHVSIVIEPVNRYEINFINRVEECAALLNPIQSDLLGIMPDVFHMNIEDAQIGGALIEHADKIRYIHLADSNRLAPGQGHTNFDEIFAALQQSSFDGWLSVEILPYPSPDLAARQAVEFLQKYIK